MRMLRVAGCVRRSLLVLVLPACIASLASAQPVDRGADALLAIDQHRASVVEHIVGAWGPALAKSPARVSIDDLRTRLAGLRADALLAASLAGTLDGLREVIGADDMSIAATKPGLSQTKALGDSAADVVYTPVTPCRLVETRGTFPAVYQGNGSASHTPVPFTSNQIRTYTLQGANGVCLTQLPAGLNATAVQLQVFGIPTTSASGDIEILPQGASFGSTATMVYVATIPFNTVSTAAKVNLANHQIGVQVRGGGAHVAIDVVGYFAAPTGSGGKFFMQGGNAFGTTAVLGTTDNQPVNINVNGARVARYEPSTFSPNVIAGHANNAAAPGSGDGNTIGGGGASGSDCFEPSTGTGTRSCGNKVTGGFNTIGGGRANVATDEGTVAGGSSNTAGVESAVGGGVGNTASGRWAAIAGGANNSVPFGDFATVGGGDTNTANGDNGTVAGGTGNTAGGNATVAGGALNTASGGASTVAGGIGNTASGGGATVAGGSSNMASGQYSFAAGHRAKATTTGTFMWADSRNFDFQPSVGNFFGVRATGGVGLTVAIDPTTGGVTQFCNLLPGVPSWQCVSDRNAKENFVPVDSEDILRRLVAMPLSTWNMKGSDPALRSLGPVAQDFHAAFGLGTDDKTIAVSNVAGVALAAVQGLHRLMQQKDAEISVLKRKLEAIEAKLGM
ncbi:MAG TPA: tail fiber domain-containing protein [Casimicrobiaceae bacterium]|nr:tail fiber domain-containing protein [Casimicrobiaceae bacterium]